MKKLIIFTLIVFNMLTLVSCSNSNRNDYKTVLFSDGLACIADKKTGKRGYVNKKFEIVIDCTYNVAYGFNDGLAIVGTRESRNIKMMLINTKGKVVTESYDEITYDYNNKIYIAFNQNPESTTYAPKDDYFLLDKKGTVIGHYRKINKFNEYNYALVTSLDYKKQFINNKGEVLISGVLEDFAYGYAIVSDKDGVWTVDSKLNKLHNFATSLERFGTTVRLYGVDSGIYYDIYGNNLGYLRREVEKDGQVLSIIGKENYWIVKYSNRSKNTVFYNITNGNKIMDFDEYRIMEDNIIILQDQNLLIYNNSLELMDKIEVPENCEIYDQYKTQDYHRKHIYFDLHENNKRLRFRLDYDKYKIERVSFLDGYMMLDYVSKDYICIREGNGQIGLMTLDGEIFFEPIYKGILVTDDGYIFIDGAVYNKKKKIVFENSQYILQYFSYPEEYYYEH